MKKFLDFIDNLEENIITVLLPLMCIVVFSATFFRYTKLLVIPWAEELARYLMIWIIFLGIGTGAKRNSHFAVEVIVNSFPKSVKKYFLILRALIVSIFCFIIILLSINIMKVQVLMQQTSPTLKIPMWIAYLAVPVGCALMIIRLIQNFINDFRNRKQLAEITVEEGK